MKNHDMADLKIFEARNSKSVYNSAFFIRFYKTLVLSLVNMYNFTILKLQA
jgi:hypothetical protein